MVHMGSLGMPAAMLVLKHRDPRAAQPVTAPAAHGAVSASSDQVQAHCYLLVTRASQREGKQAGLGTQRCHRTEWSRLESVQNGEKEQRKEDVRKEGG